MTALDNHAILKQLNIDYFADRRRALLIELDSIEAVIAALRDGLLTKEERENAMWEEYRKAGSPLGWQKVDMRRWHREQQYEAAKQAALEKQSER